MNIRKPRIDLTGKTIGKLTVLERDYEAQQNGSKGQIYWKCQCECGNIISRTTHNLTHSTTQIPSCSHCSSGFNDLTGQIFNALTVIRDSGKRKNRKILWECQCQCGNIVLRTGTILKNNTFHSCGCMDNYKQINDMTGQKFGKLTVIAPNFLYKKERGLNTSGTMYWDCICECGKTTTVSRSNLINGATTSCGNCVISKGEEQIKKILDENNISYVQQKTFPDCLSKTKTKLKFDFYIENKYLVEYDGKQHFYATGGSYFDEDIVKEIQQRDNIKNKWCLENNIPLKRIPYTVTNVTLEDIISDKYLIKKEVI